MRAEQMKQRAAELVAEIEAFDCYDDGDWKHHSDVERILRAVAGGEVLERGAKPVRYTDTDWLVIQGGEDV